MRPNAVIFAAAFFAIGAGVAWLIASSTISWVERSQKAEIEQAFYAGGIDWADAKADGFVVTLAGDADGTASQARAVKIARLIFGDTLMDETTVRQVAEAELERVQPFVEILKNGNDFVFLGQMPQGETTQVFARYVANLSDNATISNVTEPIDNTPENWLPAFEFALRLAPLTEQSILNITPGLVELEAVAITANWQQGFEELAENLRPDGVQLIVNISAPRPIISPYRFMLDVAAPDTAVCAAQDEVEATKIATKVERLIGLRIKCDVGIGAPSTHWRAAVEAGLNALAGLGGGRLEMVNAEVTLSAPEGVLQQDFEIISQILRFGLPDGFSLEAKATEAPPRRMVDVAQPLEFSAALTAEGQAVIKGAVKDELTREVMMRFSEAKFGYGRVEDRMWLDSTLPDGWQLRVFKLIEAVALLNEGRAMMTPETLEISGDASFENPDDELLKLLEAAYSMDETKLEISYTEPVGGVDGRGLDSRICVSRITKILTENRIVFAPSSAVISDPSMPTIEAIAALLTQCRDARIEIGGHTDSQGREEMNRALSQGRADAVLDALLAQNLLLGQISAKGYGESEPIADNGSETGRAANRRIEFKLLRDVAEEEAETTPPVPVGAGLVAETEFKRPVMRAPVTEDSQ